TGRIQPPRCCRSRLVAPPRLSRVGRPIGSGLVLLLVLHGTYLAQAKQQPKPVNGASSYSAVVPIAWSAASSDPARAISVGYERRRRETRTGSSPPRLPNDGRSPPGAESPPQGRAGCSGRRENRPRTPDIGGVGASPARPPECAPPFPPQARGRAPRCPFLPPRLDRRETPTKRAATRAEAVG